MAHRLGGRPPDPSLDDLYALAEDVQPAGEKDAKTVDAEGRRVDVDIEGVRYERLVSQVDHRGSLTEAVNFDRDFWAEPIVYSYCFTIRPGQLKAWGMHRKQADRYFVAAGYIRVVLYDGRAASPTFGAFATFHMTQDARALLLIPPGVWHGDQNYGDFEAVMVNFPTRPYDRDDPDKYRIDPFSGEIPFDWTLPAA